MRRLLTAAFAATAVAAPLGAQTTTIAPGVLRYGDVDCIGYNCYAGGDPTAGATLIGLGVGATSSGAAYSHGFISGLVSPSATDFAGTDRIFYGSVKTSNRDGYAGDPNAVAGPQQLALDYGSLVGAGRRVTGLTFGFQADDFQAPAFGNPYTVRVNGLVNAGLTSFVNNINQTGPQTQFFSYGIDTALLLGTNVLNVSIDQGGDGGDGWAIDFATVGVTTEAIPPQSTVPEPSSVALLGAGVAALGSVARRRVRRTVA